MGMFDTVEFTNKKGEESEVQFKCGRCLGYVYKIGDNIPLDDAIYCDWGSCFVVYNGKVVAAFDEDEVPFMHKRGFPLKFPDLNAS